MSLPDTYLKTGAPPILVLCIAFQLPNVADISEPPPPEGMKDYPSDPNYNAITSGIRDNVVQRVQGLIEGADVQRFCKAAFVQANDPQRLRDNLQAVRELPGVATAEIINVRDINKIYVP